MKNINQLIREIKQDGIENQTAARIELYQRLYKEAENTVLTLVNAQNYGNYEYEDIAADLAQLLEIFASPNGDFDRRDLALDLQRYLFTQIYSYPSYDAWRAYFLLDEPHGANANGEEVAA